MSKEQTPITAEEWLDEEYSYILDGFEYLEIDKQVLDVMEQYAKQKVLEALEPQKELIEELLTIFDGNGVPNIRYVTELINAYNETEVKPKYE